MNKLDVKTNPEVEAVFSTYPDEVCKKLLFLRELIFEAAEEIESVSSLEETLKWGEPSYLCKHGSTLRMDWKKKTPNQYAMHFKCTSRLVETFKEVYKNNFNYEGNRAIVFQMNDKIHKDALKECIKATLSYHKVKKLPLLGMSHK